VKFIGLNVWAWGSPFRTGEHLPLFEKVRAFGGQVVEFALEEDALVDARAIRQALRDNGLGCSIVSLYGPARDLSLGDEAQRAGLDYTRRSIDLCAEVGASILTGAAMGVGGTEVPLEVAQPTAKGQRTPNSTDAPAFGSCCAAAPHPGRRDGWGRERTTHP